MKTQIINSRTENLIKTIPSLVKFIIGDYLYGDDRSWHVDVTMFNLDNNVLKVYVTQIK